jgi:hypothetical protein
MTSCAVEFWQARKCYYFKKFKQLGRFSAIWQAKFYWAIYRLEIQRELEQAELREF